VVDVGVAEANLSVAESEARRLEAWVGYLKLLAPYDGIVVARNANTGDFVLPATGDPTADRQAPDLSPNGKAAPIYVVDRTDVVRVFVDIPERDANYVRSGAKAKVLVEAFSDEEIDAIVVRTSWALNVTSRTLRAEIDLLNTGSKIPDDLPETIRNALEGVKLPKTTSQLLPGMYAYGKVTIERGGVLAIPIEQLVLSNGKSYIWRVVDGKAARFEVQTGADDGKWIELRKQRLAVSASGSTDEHPWMPWDGSEQVIASDVATLIDGEPLHITTADAGSKDANATVR
jgi:multidrug efflux pump subunit AcrA (membrane-fusion protein)